MLYKTCHLSPFVLDCMDTGGRAPTVGALGDAGAVAESLLKNKWI